MTQLPDWTARITSPLDNKLGLTLTELTPERVCGSMPVAGNEQPMGLLHGGATGVIIETLASMGAMAHGYPGRAGVGVDLNVTHLLAVRSGHVHGTATALHLGRNVVTYAVEVRDDAGRLTATGRLTCHMIDLPSTGR